MNEIIIIGNLGNDIEINETSNGKPVANLRVATSFGKGDKQKTEWHNVVLFGKTAELAGEHLEKGARVLIRGRIQTRKWQDTEGNDRYTTETVASRLEFKGKGGGSANRVLIVGNLGADPETAYTQSGLAVVNFRIASNERYKDGDGNSQTRTEWHKCVGFGKLAEFCGEYLEKGSEVYIEGHLHTRKWQDKEGNDHYITEVMVSELKALGGGKGSSDQTPVPEPPSGDDVPF